MKYSLSKTLLIAGTLSFASCGFMGSSPSGPVNSSSNARPLTVPSASSACTQLSGGLAPTIICGASPVPRLSPAVLPPAVPAPSSAAVPPAVTPAGMKFVAYWEGEGSLSSMPQGITCVDLAFGTISGSQVQFDSSGFGGDSALTSGISAMHAKGVSVMLSLGGAGNDFSFTGNMSAFTTSLQSVMLKYQFDGVDFDDEQDADASTRASVLNQLIPASRQLFVQMGKSTGLITLAAYGGNPADFGDGTVLQTSGSALSWVNLMAYAPSVSSIQSMVTPYNGLIALNKLVVGGIDNGGDMGGPPSIAVSQQLATWVQSQGYGGVMMWTIDQGQQYVQPVASILGT